MDIASPENSNSTPTNPMARKESEQQRVPDYASSSISSVTSSWSTSSQASTASSSTTSAAHEDFLNCRSEPLFDDVDFDDEMFQFDSDCYDDHSSVSSSSSSSTSLSSSSGSSFLPPPSLVDKNPVADFLYSASLRSPKSSPYCSSTHNDISSSINVNYAVTEPALDSHPLLLVESTKKPATIPIPPVVHSSCRNQLSSSSLSSTTSTFTSLSSSPSSPESLPSSASLSPPACLTSAKSKPRSIPQKQEQYSTLSSSSLSSSLSSLSSLSASSPKSTSTSAPPKKQSLSPPSLFSRTRKSSSKTLVFQEALSAYFSFPTSLNSFLSFSPTTKTTPLVSSNHVKSTTPAKSGSNVQLNNIASPPDPPKCPHGDIHCNVSQVQRPDALRVFILEFNMVRNRKITKRLHDREVILKTNKAPFCQRARHLGPSPLRNQVYP